MFAPNKYDIDVPKTQIHHRGMGFKTLYDDFSRIFRNKFSINEKYDFLLYNGSGSQTIEKVIQSLNFNLNHPHSDGKFESRWNIMSKYYNKKKSKNNNCIVQFETSISKKREASESYLVDAVCAFPYYRIPDDFKILVTVSSKLIGAAPVLGIIIYDKSILKDLDNSVPGGLSDWIKYSKMGQTPYTPSISLLASLVNEIKFFNLDELNHKINYVSDMILDIVGPNGIYGDKRAPAISIYKKHVNLARCAQLEIYGMHTNNDYIQIFTYSEKIEKYKTILPQILKK
jgi:hypothetical protein